MVLFNRDILFFALLATIPGWFMNQFLLKRIQPKQSIKHFLLYILAVLVITFAYTFIICWILFKYVWPVK